jgi:hypothetical protein
MVNGEWSMVNGELFITLYLAWRRLRAPALLPFTINH